MLILRYIPLLSCIFVFGLGLFVLAKQGSKPVKAIFFCLCLVVSVWLFGTFMMFSTVDDRLAIFWDRFIYAGVVFVPPLMHHFSLLITRKKTQCLLLGVNYLLAVIFMILSQTRFFVDGLFHYPWGVHTKAQFFHHLFLVQFFFFIYFLFYNIYSFYKSGANPLERAQAKYVLVAFGALVGIGAFAYLPAYGISIFPFSFISGVIFTVVLAYAILRHRFMDIRIAAKNGFIFIVSFVITLAAGNLLWTFLGKINSNVSTDVFVVLSVSLIIYPFIRRMIERFANKRLFYSIRNYHETIRSLSEALIKMIDMSQIVNKLVDTILGIMKLERGGVLLIDGDGAEKRYRIQKVVGFNEENGISLVKDSFLTRQLEKTQKPLLLDELGLLANEVFGRIERENLTRLQEQMRKIEAALCLPLISNNKLIGIIVLGNKLSDEAYTEEDLNLLETLSNQTAVAIANARLYDQVQQFNATLQARVDEQTKNLKEQSQRLQELLDIKSDFLRVANHQLNTPLSVAKNAFELLKDQTYTIEQALPAIQDGFTRLDAIISDFLKA